MVEKEDQTPLALRLWGIPIDRAIIILQTVGIPTLFMIFICYLVWSYVPPVANAHIKLLERTGDTLEKMDETLKQSTKILTELSEVEKLKPVFMSDVRASHTKAQDSLDRIESTVVKKPMRDTSLGNK